MEGELFNNEAPMGSDVKASRKQRLRTLENIIRKGMEEFVATGFALKEIRDDELYDEDGFDTWDRYLKERVGVEFGIEQTQVRHLILCAQVRPKLPDPIVTAVTNPRPAWSIKEVREFARLAPKKDEPGQPYDVERLDKRDVQRVAKKVIEHCKETGEDLTSTVVRKFVDADLGVDRVAQAKETKRQREGESHPDLFRSLVDMTGRILGDVTNLATVPPQAWKQLSEDNPDTVKRLIAACESLADLLRRIEE